MLTILGVILALACTAVLDASGLTIFSALPLIPLFALFAWLERIKPRELGLTLGRPLYYIVAVAHPLLVMGALAALALSGGAMGPAGVDWPKALTNIALLAGTTMIMAIVTEEGFFRGWLWASVSRQGGSPLPALAITTVAFVLWHVSYVFLSDEFQFARSDIPLFFANATLLGLIWGLLRFGSGSIVVSSVGHGLWNGLAYVLFGIASGTGVLGIRDVTRYGPEVGVYGVVLNGLFAAALAWSLRHKLMAPTGATQPA